MDSKCCCLQAGTQFWDQTLEGELRQGRLTNASFDRCIVVALLINSISRFANASFSCGVFRYSMILFAGIAAEAIVFGEAEGGESDENLFKAIVSVIRPPWTPAQVGYSLVFILLPYFMILLTPTVP